MLNQDVYFLSRRGSDRGEGRGSCHDMKYRPTTENPSRGGAQGRGEGEVMGLTAHLGPHGTVSAVGGTSYRDRM
jgi:hypothetical protein